MPAMPDIKLPEGDKQARLEFLRELLVLNDATCKAKVYAGKQVVFGVGNLDAAVMSWARLPVATGGPRRTVSSASGQR